MPFKQQVAAIIVAAGRGTRMNQATQPKKQFRRVAGRTLLEWSVAAFHETPSVTTIVVVTGADDLDSVKETLYAGGLTEKLTAVVPGGESRKASVANGLQVLDDSVGWVLVHDAVRPLVTPELVQSVLRTAQTCGAATAALPVNDTVKRVGPDQGVIETLERSELWATQTPQAFRRDVLLRAHRESGERDATDDAGLVERIGLEVRVVEGSARNLKVTTEPDLDIARMWLSEARMDQYRSDDAHWGWEVATGFGFDVHRLVNDRPLVLGGVRIEHDRGLLGHSDADVLVHAVIDALLGAASLGDIGTHFPDTDQKYKGAESLALLRVTCEKLAEAGCVVTHVDSFVSAEAPRLKGHVPTMRSRLAEAMGIEEARVSIKAGTGEGAGPVGLAEVIEARALATIRRRY